MYRNLIIFLLLSSSLMALKPADIEKKFESRIRKYTLKNGLRVILMKNGFTPTLACYLKVGVGSANEPFDQSGLAHFLEHLLFKGNEKLGTRNFEKEKIFQKQVEVEGERADAQRRKLLDPLLGDAKRQQLMQRLKNITNRMNYLQKFQRRYILSEEDSKAYSLAGQVGYNAYTSADVTNYQIKLPKNRLELWAYLESNRFINPVFREFYPERSVIIEERRMRTDSRPGSQLYELYIRKAFGMSPYGKPVIGFASNIPKMTMSDTRDFFERNYIPSRMVITIVGDLEFEPTLAIIRKHFSKLKAKPEPEFPPIEFEGSKGKVTAVLEAQHTPTLITGWHKPSIYHKDDIYFEVLSKLLTDGRTSRLYERLVVKEKLASYVYSYNGNPGEKLNNTMSIHLGAYKFEYYDKILKIIDEEIEKLQKDGPSEAEMKKVKTRFAAELINSLASNAGLANSLSYYELLLGDYRKFFALLKRIEKATPADIQRISKQYLIDRNNTTVYIKKPSNP